MNRYKLFSEWRNVELYGDTFTEAITRHPRLQRTDTYRHTPQADIYARQGETIHGEWITVAKVIGEPDQRGYRRGNDLAISLLVELSDGRIERIDAVCEEVKFKE